MNGWVSPSPPSSQVISKPDSSSDPTTSTPVPRYTAASPSASLTRSAATEHSPRSPDGADGFTTISLTAHYLRRATEGETLTGVATLIQGGRQLQTWDVAIATNGRIVAQVRLTQLLRYPRP